MTTRKAAKMAARRAAWDRTLSGARREDGFYEELGAEHKALYLPQDGDAGRTLVVVFDNLDDARQDADRLPWAVDFISAMGWSSLGLMAHGPTWYRDDAVHDFFDRLRDDGFFEGFERVVFYGTSMGGYAAAAFSAAAPGATVIAVNPQATLERAAVPWEVRYRPAWARDYTSRYGYAPDMALAAERMWLFYDSQIREDAMHASLFRGARISKIRCPHMGHGMLSMWREIGVLKSVVSGCIDGSMTETGVHKLMRARHRSPKWQKAVLGHLIAQGRDDLVIRWCAAVCARRPAPHFRNAARIARRALQDA